ncbi:esterase OVCA2-like [Tripterygium wilfordii]|uniref:esterase OVCA2-like n=1 Tax=Tripterygium wilfordii TaxID=458696 RepID=UPI0018F81D61|nr:esterase OVCA2-like [Tripterygium wilfordii]
MEENHIKRKPRILCLHGFRSSAEILKKQVSVWPETVLERLDLHFLNAPFPAEGKSGHEGIFDPPYFEWFQANEDYSEYRNFEECVAYIEHYTMKHGPFDGFLGFSQGALLTAALPGMQLHGVTLTKVPRIKFVIVISGGKLGGSKFGLPEMAASAFSSLIECPSLHIMGIDLFALYVPSEIKW